MILPDDLPFEAISHPTQRHWQPDPSRHLCYFQVAKQQAALEAQSKEFSRQQESLQIEQKAARDHAGMFWLALSCLV